jgi:hypothetical protein
VTPGTDRVRHRGRRALVFVLLGLGIFTMVQVARAGMEARRARAALLRSEASLSTAGVDPARADLTSALASLERMKAQLDRLGPILSVSRRLPLIGTQVVAVETFQRSGVRLADAGLQVTGAVQDAVSSSNEGSAVAGGLDNLRTVSRALSEGIATVDAASEDMRRLDGKLLIGPVAGARRDLDQRLPKFQDRAASAARGLDALIRFAGGDGPRRYLFLNQNPDEIRPTGGFIGTYAVLAADGQGLHLDQFSPTEKFNAAHPDVAVAGSETGSPFRFARPPIRQTMSNVNDVADFTKAARLAVDLWKSSGETPVDGVVSFTPAFLARILGVLGPVQVPDYQETVSADNLIARFDYYTQQLETDPNANIARKGFVGSLARVVLDKALGAPPSQWQAIGKAMGDGFAGREGMAWSTDASVAGALAERHWDGTLPEVAGDFFYNAEFSYAAKFDRLLRRSFDHHVVIHSDGSATITTTLVMNNPGPPAGLNPGSLSYVTLYGPAGAVLGAVPEPPVSPEPPMAGHAAAGWFLSAPPLGSATLQVVWEAPDIARRTAKGWEYSLSWLRVPDHTGDELHLQVDLPDGWSWEDTGPPATFNLDSDVRGVWPIAG